jgi:hypothetical protein
MNHISGLKDMNSVVEIAEIFGHRASVPIYVDTSTKCYVEIFSQLEKNNISFFRQKTKKDNCTMLALTRSTEAPLCT